MLCRVIGDYVHCPFDRACTEACQLDDQEDP